MNKLIGFDEADQIPPPPASGNKSPLLSEVFNVNVECLIITAEDSIGNPGSPSAKAPPTPVALFPEKVEFSIEPKLEIESNEDEKITHKFSKDDIKKEVRYKAVTPPRPEPVHHEISTVIEDEVIEPLTEIIIDEENHDEEFIESKIEELPEVIEEVEEISEEEEIQTALDTIKSIDFDDGMRKIAEDKIKEKILQARALREIKAEEEKALIEQEEEEELELVNQIEEEKQQKQKELSEFWD